jgi:hypothetical protein
MVETITLIIERPGVSSVGSGRATPIYVRQQWETHAGRARVGSNSIQLFNNLHRNKVLPLLHNKIGQVTNHWYVGS